jgi:hypothetical protein
MTPFLEGDRIASRKRRAGSGQSWLAVAVDGVEAGVESLLIARLREKQSAPLLDAVKISEDELRAAYEARRDTAFTTPAAVKLAVLWFNTRGQPRLEQIRAQINGAGEPLPAAAPALSIHPVAAGFELRWASVRALTDVRIGLDESAGLGEWADSPVLRAEKREWQPDGRIRHSYGFSAEPAVRSRFFRLRPQLLPAP